MDIQKEKELDRRDESERELDKGKVRTSLSISCCIVDSSNEVVSTTVQSSATACSP